MCTCLELHIVLVLLEECGLLRVSLRLRELLSQLLLAEDEHLAERVSLHNCAEHGVGQLMVLEL